MAPFSFAVLYATLGFFAAVVNLIMGLILNESAAPSSRMNGEYCAWLIFFNMALSAYFGFRRGQRVKQKWLVSQP